MGHQSLQLQHDSQMGLLSLGLAQALLDDHLELALLYGFAPASVTGTDIHTLSARTRLVPLHLRMARNLWLQPYLGLGAHFSRVRVQRTSLYGTVFCGLRWRWRLPRQVVGISSVALSTEAGYLHTDLRSAARSQEVALLPLTFFGLGAELGL